MYIKYYIKVRTGVQPGKLPLAAAAAAADGAGVLVADVAGWRGRGGGVGAAAEGRVSQSCKVADELWLRFSELKKSKITCQMI